MSKREFVEKDGKKYLVKTVRVDIDMHSFIGSLDNLGVFVHQLKQQYGESAILDIYQYYDDIEFYIEYKTPETDKEREKRLLKEKKAAETRKKNVEKRLKNEEDKKEKALKELERLAKELGKKII